MYIPLVDEISLGLGSMVGCPLDQAKVLVWLIIHVGCGYGYRKIEGYIPRLVYGMVLGTIFCISMFSICIFCLISGETCLLYFFLTIVYYITMQYRSRAATYVYIGGFLFLSGYHLKRMWESKHLFREIMLAMIWISLLFSCNNLLE